MLIDEVGDDFECKIHVEDYRIGEKVEYKVAVYISFISRQTNTRAQTHWCIWRPFSLFRILDHHLRRVNTNHMKNIKFPPLHRRHSLLGGNKSVSFLDTRMQELQKYIGLVIEAPNITDFHRLTIQNQSMKTFVGFPAGFGLHASYGPSRSRTHSKVGNLNTSITSSRSMVDPSLLRRSEIAIPYPRHITTAFRRPSLGYVNENCFASGWMSERPTGEASRVSCPPALNRQRGEMEQRLVQVGLQGVGMPPDGSCLLHCLVYEMFPLKCLEGYPSNMTQVHCGALDRRAFRRLEAATKLRREMGLFALKHMDRLSEFLMLPQREIMARFQTFMRNSSEPATIAELYAAASMFNLEIKLVSNDSSFHIDPVCPVPGIQAVRLGNVRTITLGYMCPCPGAAGHYICTQEYVCTNQKEDVYRRGSYQGTMKIESPRPSLVYESKRVPLSDCTPLNKSCPSTTA